MEDKKEILIVDNHSKNTDKLVRLFPECDVTVCDCDDFTTKKAADYGVIVFSGGSHVYAADKTKLAYNAEVDFIKNTDKTVIGICLGCQLIAKAFGGKLEKLEEKRHGIFDLKYKSKQYKVYESHKYTIDKLPPQLELIAESVTGAEIIKHKTKPIYGFQFHPEVFPRKTVGKKLFFSILDRVIASEPRQSINFSS